MATITVKTTEKATRSHAINYLFKKHNTCNSMYKYIYIYKWF